MAICPHAVSPVLPMVEAAQRRAAGLALSVPQALDCHDSACYTALESYSGTTHLGAASPSQQPGP